VYSPGPFSVYFRYSFRPGVHAVAWQRRTYPTRQLIHDDRVEQGRKKIERKLPHRSTLLFLARTRSYFTASLNTGDKPPVSWRERTSHVTRRFPATADATSTPRKSTICSRRRRTVSGRCLPARPLTIYAVIYKHEARRKVSGVVRP